MSLLTTMIRHLGTDSAKSANRTSPLSKITANDLDPTNPHHVPAKNSGTAHITDLSIASKLPLPQILTALRTVILLH